MKVHGGLRAIEDSHVKNFLQAIGNHSKHLVTSLPNHHMHVFAKPNDEGTPPASQELIAEHGVESLLTGKYTFHIIDGGLRFTAALALWKQEHANSEHLTAHELLLSSDLEWTCRVYATCEF